MPAHKGKRVTMLGYMIHVKTTTTNSGSYMSFGSFIDPAGDFWDSTQFPIGGRALSVPWARGVRSHRLRGRGVRALRLRTQHMEKLPWKPDPRYGET